MNKENENILKDELNRLAHDMMNPLTVVLGYAQLLSSRTDLPEDVTQQANDIYQQALESASIAEEIKKLVASEKNPNIGSVVILDPEGTVFDGLKHAVGSGAGLYHAEGMETAVDLIVSKGIDTVIINLDSVDFDNALVQLNSALPGVNMVMVTKDRELAENLQSMGYIVLIQPLERPDVLSCFNGLFASSRC